MRRCFIDAATSHGITGWAIGSRQGAPCRLRIESDGQVLARAVARGFRRDLLEAGIGHGHYAFVARFATPRPLAGHSFMVFEDGVEEPLPGNGLDGFMLAAEPPAAALPVEELLEQVDHWTAEDLQRHTAVLRLDANMAAMGVARFVDVTFRYVLARWPDAAGADGYGRALAQGETTPDGLFRTLLLSDERRRVHEPLVTPYDSQFPYDIG